MSTQHALDALDRMNAHYPHDCTRATRAAAAAIIDLLTAHGWAVDMVGQSRITLTLPAGAGRAVIYAAERYGTRINIRTGTGSDSRIFQSQVWPADPDPEYDPEDTGTLGKVDRFITGR